ncbi:uncharacterized protein RHOBADRAFT_56336, partial [Rhodotorula graminis WP1]
AVRLCPPVSFDQGQGRAHRRRRRSRHQSARLHARRQARRRVPRRGQEHDGAPAAAAPREQARPPHGRGARPDDCRAPHVGRPAGVAPVLCGGRRERQRGELDRAHRGRAPPVPARPPGQEAPAQRRRVRPRRCGRSSCRGRGRRRRRRAGGAAQGQQEGRRRDRLVVVAQGALGAQEAPPRSARQRRCRRPRRRRRRHRDRGAAPSAARQAPQQRAPVRGSPRREPREQRRVGQARARRQRRPREPVRPGRRARVPRDGRAGYRTCAARRLVVAHAPLAGHYRQRRPSALDPPRPPPSSSSSPFLFPSAHLFSSPPSRRDVPVVLSHAGFVSLHVLSL